MQVIASNAELTKIEALTDQLKGLFDEDYVWHLKFQDKLRQSGYIKDKVYDVVAGPIVDAEGNAFYGQDTSEILLTLLGRNWNRQSIASLDSEVVTFLK